MEKKKLGGGITIITRCNSYWGDCSIYYYTSELVSKEPRNHSNIRCSCCIRAPRIPEPLLHTGQVIIWRHRCNYYRVEDGDTAA